MTIRHRLLTRRPLIPCLLAFCVSVLQPFSPSAFSQNAAEARAEHAAIGVDDNTKLFKHTDHPDAQWFGDAAFGLFLHWDISSVRAMNISWPMIPGRPLAAKEITDPAERERIVRENDYNLDGKPNSITPDDYFSMAAQFNPQRYDPEKWAAAAKAAGFTYVVLTTRHHGGFALWPSATGGYDTKNYMGGRDLVKPYVEALRRHGLKVGFYYSPPDWHFDRDYKNFLYGGGARKNPWLPPLGPDLKPRTNTHTPEEIAAHQAAYVAHVNNQIEELLTRYGKIDVLWFDGKPEARDAMKSLITPERIRELQPGIVFNPRLFGTGDFGTFERSLPATRPVVDWAEYCNTWTSNWSHVDTQPFRATGYVLGQLAQCRAWGINYLIGVGPTRDGELVPEIYANLATVSEWMKANGAAIHAKPLPKNETSSHFATAVARGGHRYLFALPAFSNPRAPLPQNQLPPVDETLTLSGIPYPSLVTLLATGKTLAFTYDNATRTLTVALPAALRTKLVDVVYVQIPSVPGSTPPAPAADTLWMPDDKPNAPVGTARGIFPGRVTWARDIAATPWDGVTGNWWADGAGINQAAVDRMVSRSLRDLSGARDDAAAWTALFRYHNRTHARGDRGYKAGEKIAVKINVNNAYAGHQDADNQIDASAQTVRAMLYQLTKCAGVPEEAITVYEATRVIPDRIFQKCHAEFPRVTFADSKGASENGRARVQYAKKTMHYSVPDSKVGEDLPTFVVEAAYIINLSLVKGHPTTGVTLTAKNHYGTVNVRDHTVFVNSHAHAMATYHPFVDMIGSKQLGGKTLLFMLDGLYGLRDVNDAVGENARWRKLFNGEWLASIFMSQDPVAIDSVGLDFLRSEFPLGRGKKPGVNESMANADNYMHEAAQAANPPSGVKYAPDGEPLKSLGVHEHWNNARDKQYTRNLDPKTGKGIELRIVPLE